MFCQCEAQMSLSTIINELLDKSHMLEYVILITSVYCVIIHTSNICLKHIYLIDAVTFVVRCHV